MSPSFPEHAEQSLLSAVRRRRQWRRRRRAVGSSAILLVLAVLLWRGITPPPERRIETAPTGPAHTTIATHSGAYRLPGPRTNSLIVVHTDERLLPQAIDDSQLFARLPRARIRIDEDGTEQLIWED